MYKKPDLSIIIVNYHAKKRLFNCLSSLVRNAGNLTYEIIVIDNDEIKKIQQDLKNTFPKVKYVKNNNKGYGQGCNIGASVARGKYLFFLNPDTEVYEGSISSLTTIFEKNKKVGIVAPLLLSPQKKPYVLQGSQILTPLNEIFVYSFIDKYFPNNYISNRFWLGGWKENRNKQVDVVPGTALVISSSVFKKIGGFDEGFFLFFEEYDICKRIKDLGFKSFIIPELKIIHFWGESTKHSSLHIKKIFLSSRYKYIRKFHGFGLAILTEFFLRYVNISGLAVFFLFLLSAFINTYKLNSLMLLIGDAARDFLAARDMLLTGRVPLVGIPSSVPWLHQGPISIWAIALAFAVSHFNPVAPAIFFGIISAVTTVLVYFLGKLYFDERTGAIAGILFAVSPIIVVNARMPYHTSLIPFFASIFFLILHKVISGNKKLMFLLFFTFGVLLLVELSNVVVFGIVLSVLLLYKVKIGWKEFAYSFAAFALGIVPFIAYDIINGPTYAKFPLWILNRVRLFFGLTLHHNSTTNALPGALVTIYQQISGALLPEVPLFSWFIVLCSATFLVFEAWRKGIKKPLIIFLWLFIPLAGFLLHASPGTAYFTLIYPAVALSIGFVFSKFVKKYRVVMLIVIGIAFINMNLLVKNDFFVTSVSGNHPMPPTMYNFGSSWTLSDELVLAIIHNANGNKYKIEGGGFISKFPTGIDPYIFLSWWHKVPALENAKISYVIYQQKNEIPKGSSLIFSDPLSGYVIKR